MHNKFSRVWLINPSAYRYAIGPIDIANRVFRTLWRHLPSVRQFVSPSHFLDRDVFARSNRHSPIPFNSLRGGRQCVEVIDIRCRELGRQRPTYRRQLPLAAWQRWIATVRVSDAKIENSRRTVKTISAYPRNGYSVARVSIFGPIPWGHSGPLCHALSLSLSLLSMLLWTSMSRRRATVAVCDSSDTWWMAM